MPVIEGQNILCNVLCNILCNVYFQNYKKELIISTNLTVPNILILNIYRKLFFDFLTGTLKENKASGRKHF